MDRRHLSTMVLAYYASSSPANFAAAAAVLDHPIHKWCDGGVLQALQEGVLLGLLSLVAAFNTRTALAHFDLLTGCSVWCCACVLQLGHCAAASAGPAKLWG